MARVTYPNTAQGRADALAVADPKHIIETASSLLVLTEENLDPTLPDQIVFDASGDGYRQTMRQSADRGRRGMLGVGNKAVIALRFDDWQGAFLSTIQPLLQTRGLPHSIALISGFPTAQPTHVGAATWDSVRAWSQRGTEIWCHGYDHKDYLGYAGLYANVVTSKQTIEAQGLPVQGWSMPGVTPIYTADQRGNATPYNGLDTEEKWNSVEGRLLMQTYALTESYSGGSFREIPNGAYHGSSHQTIDSVSLATATEWVDRCIKWRLALRIMCHPAMIGSVGYMSLADFTSFLDYVVTKWDAGLLEVVTPSALPYVDQSTSRLDLLNGSGSFAGIDVGTPGVWNNVGGTSNSFPQTGGKDNGPYLLIPSAGGSSGPNARPENLNYRGLRGRVFLFEGWCKCMDGSGTTSARVIIKDYPTKTNLDIDQVYTGVGIASWQRVRIPFTIPMTTAAGAETGAILIQPHRNGGGSCGWSQVSVKAV